MQVLDIFIGLVLIYFLYSLLTSIIVEMLSTWMGLRARHLRQGIDNLLNDRPISTENVDIKKQLYDAIKLRNFRSVWETDLFRWLKDILLVENDSFKYTAAGKFYQLPEIKSLAKRGDNFWLSLRNTKPSYISKETYSKALISMFSEKAQGTTLWEKVQFSVNNNALHLDQETAKRLNNLMIQANGKYENFIVLIEMEYEEMMDRLNGWYKRKIGFFIFWIGFFICTLSNVDSIQLTKIISKNEHVRNELVSIAEKKINNESFKNDSTQTKKELNEEYRKAQNDIYNVSNILGLGWQYHDVPKNKKFCIDSISRVYADSIIINNHKIDTLKNAWKYDLKHIKTIVSSDSKKTIVNAKAVSDNNHKIDSLKNPLKNGPDTTNSDSLYNNAEYKQSIDSSKIKELETTNEKQLELLRHKIDSKLTQIDSVSNDERIYYQKSPNAFEKGSQIIGKLWKNPISLLGILITALALSLGAQFWFDLLKKLVALRGAGKKPEEESNTKEKISKSLKLSNDGKYPLTSDPFELLISEERANWEALPGFLGFNREINKASNSEFIEVLIEEHFLVPPNRIIKNISIEFRKTTKPELGCVWNNSKMPKDSIKQDVTGAVGTVTGIVYNPRTKKNALLTCGHVARTSNNSFFERDNTTASICVGNEWKVIGKVSNVVMSCYADGGVIDINSNIDMESLSKTFKKIIEFRNALNNDIIYKTEFTVQKRDGVVTKAHLLSKSRYFTFSDILKNDVKYFDLLKFENILGPSVSLSQPGDSGSLITDDKGIPVGVLIGAHNETNAFSSFAIKLSDIFEILQIKPYRP